MLLRSVRSGLLPRRDRPTNSSWNMMRLVDEVVELVRSKLADSERRFSR